MHAAASAPSQSLSDAERAHIMGILKETNWVVGGRNGAAARLGLPRTTLIFRMQKLGISNNTGRFHLASLEAAAFAPPQCAAVFSKLRECNKNQALSVALYQLFACMVEDPDRHQYRVAPVCPHGCSITPPYSCVPIRLLRVEWFNSGVLIGTGPWFHRPNHFYGHVDKRIDPHHDYRGPIPWVVYGAPLASILASTMLRLRVSYLGLTLRLGLGSELDWSIRARGWG
jgi:hypothetical protein